VTLGRQLGDLREISGELKQGDKLVGTPPLDCLTALACAWPRPEARASQYERHA